MRDNLGQGVRRCLLVLGNTGDKIWRDFCSPRKIHLVCGASVSGPCVTDAGEQIPLTYRVSEAWTHSSYIGLTSRCKESWSEINVI